MPPTKKVTPPSHGGPTNQNFFCLPPKKLPPPSHRGPTNQNFFWLNQARRNHLAPKTAIPRRFCLHRLFFSPSAYPYPPTPWPSVITAARARGTIPTPTRGDRAPAKGGRRRPHVLLASWDWRRAGREVAGGDRAPAMRKEDVIRRSSWDRRAQVD